MEIIYMHIVSDYTRIFVAEHLNDGGQWTRWPQGRIFHVRPRFTVVNVSWQVTHPMQTETTKVETTSFNL
jgi:hypothetical protein